MGLPTLRSSLRLRPWHLEAKPWRGAFLMSFFDVLDLIANCGVPSGGPSTTIHYKCGSWFLYRQHQCVYLEVHMPPRLRVGFLRIRLAHSPTSAEMPVGT